MPIEQDHQEFPVTPDPFAQALRLLAIRGDTFSQRALTRCHPVAQFGFNPRNPDAVVRGSRDAPATARHAPPRRHGSFDDRGRVELAGGDSHTNSEWRLTTDAIVHRPAHAPEKARALADKWLAIK